MGDSRRIYLSDALIQEQELDINSVEGTDKRAYKLTRDWTSDAPPLAFTTALGNVGRRTDTCTPALLCETWLELSDYKGNANRPLRKLVKNLKREEVLADVSISTGPIRVGVPRHLSEAADVQKWDENRATEIPKEMYLTSHRDEDLADARLVEQIGTGTGTLTHATVSNGLETWSAGLPSSTAITVGVYGRWMLPDHIKQVVRQESQCIATSDISLASIYGQASKDECEGDVKPSDDRTWFCHPHISREDESEDESDGPERP